MDLLDRDESPFLRKIAGGGKMRENLVLFLGHGKRCRAEFKFRFNQLKFWFVLQDQWLFVAI